MLLPNFASAQTANERSHASLVEELRLSVLLIEALERENSSLRQRLATEKSTTMLLTELAETRKTEAAALRETVAAKNETIAVKQTVIDAQQKHIDELRKRRTSVWKRILDIAAGAAIGVILR